MRLARLEPDVAPQPASLGYRCPGDGLWRRWICWWIGAASLPDAPYVMRVAQRTDTRPGVQHLDMQDAASRLEQRLHSDPSNAEGWLLYAHTVASLGNWPKAAEAYRHAIDIGQKAPDVLAGYGGMLVLGPRDRAAGGARCLCHGAHETGHDVARYYSPWPTARPATNLAIRAWLALAADIPDDSPMRESISRGIAEAAKAGGIAAPPLPKGTPPPPGPTEDQMSAAAQMPEAQRNEMIRGMVAQLAAHLDSEPGDLDGWLRLGRSYSVLGETDKSVDAYAHAEKLRPDDVDIKLLAFRAMIAGLQPTDILPPRALAMLREVATTAPDQPEVLWYLGVNAARTGHPDEARSNWSKLLSELPPDGEDSKLVKSALDSLPGK
jgi:cytochrome c-type biogenesis protein CcmH